DPLVAAIVILNSCKWLKFSGQCHRGSNVSSGEMLKPLLTLEQNIPSSSRTKITFNLVVDDELILKTEEFKDNCEAFAYVCGYLARRFKNDACGLCKETILGCGKEDFNAVIVEK